MAPSAGESAMTIRCPICQTQYRIPDTKLTSAKPVFKCTRCSLVFRLEDDKARASARPKKRAVDNLDLPFDEQPTRGRGKRRASDEPAFVASSAGDDTALFEDEDELEIEIEDGPDGGDFEEDLVEETDEEEEDEDPGPVLFTSAATRGRASVREKAPPPEAESRSPLRPIIIGVSMIVALFVALTGYLGKQSGIALDLLASIPILGKTIAQDDLLAWRFELADVKGSLDRIKGGRLAYVVEGSAINTSAQGIRLVEIEGRLLADGQLRRTQRVYAGNQNRATIRDLSATEVEMLLRLEPNRRFRIPPGGAARFLLVFPDPPPDAREIDCRVVTARAS